jgi:hypothetical protein
MTAAICLRVAVVAMVVFVLIAPPRAAATFDHEYVDYAKLLHDHLRGSRVDYTELRSQRTALDAVVAQLAATNAAEFGGWTRDERLAFWINAYNVLTLRAIVDHYPIRSATFTLQPRNSIRQIDGVWTTLTWQAAGRTLTLDDIEHRILRPEFKEPRVHFAINCASVGCPPLRPDPYRASTLNAQLDEAARRYLASERGLTIDGHTVRVTKILEWYGEDFVARYAPNAGGKPDRVEQAIRGVVEQFGPPAAAELARNPSTKIKFLDYDWSLNDIK